MQNSVFDETHPPCTLADAPMPGSIDWPRASLAAMLLCASCSVMVTAWYLHLRAHDWGMPKAIGISWAIAGAEYCLQVPGNRIGASAGLSAAQLRGLAELAILVSFIAFQTKVLRQPLLWNHVVGFAVVLVGVLIVLCGPFTTEVATSERVALPLRVSAVAEEMEALDLQHTGAGLLPELPPASPPPSPSSAATTSEESSPLRVAEPPPPPPPPVPSAASSRAAEFATRLAWTAEASRRPREAALAELAAGRKRGHWVWWVFPTLHQRGGDANSARQDADLMSVDEAEAYASHAELRSGLLASFDAASAAFGAAAAGGAKQVTWLVLDSGFGRAADGVWVAGPVDAFKLRCSATLFGALAQRAGDAALLAAARRVLAFYTGDGVVYTAAGRGTAGYHAPDQGAANVASVPARNVLRGCDKATLRLLRRAGQEAAAFEVEVAVWEEALSCDP